MKMSQENLTVAIINAHQSDERADQSTPKLVEDVRALVTTIESLELADIIVVSTDNPVVDQAARELGAVNRLEPKGSEPSASAVAERIIESEESTVEEEAWVLYIDSRLADFDFPEAMRRAFTARSVNGDVRGLRATGIDVDDVLHFFQAGAFLESRKLPVSGAIDFLAD
jgi:hypothetical protein